MTTTRVSFGDPNDDLHTLPPSDEELGAMLQQNDARALSALSKEPANRLRGILGRQFGNYLGDDELKEIVADTLVTAVQKGHRYQPALSSVMRWLTVLAHYRALRYLREKRLFSNVQLDVIAELIADKTEEFPRIVVEQPSEKIESLLQRLPATQAKVIRWHFYDDLTIEEIAELLGIEVVSVRVYKSRGLKSLREWMADEDE